MSIQLILQPQNIQGFTSSISTITGQMLVDGNSFNGINSANQLDDSSGNIFHNIFTNYPATTPNTWYTFKQDTAISYPTEVSNNLLFTLNPTTSLVGVYQQLTNLIVGQVYTVTLEFLATPSAAFLFAHSGSGSNSYNTIGFPAGISQSLIFTATSTNDTILIAGYNAVGTSTATISSISIVGATQLINVLNGDGQVICDLYEDEDLPLTLSVDEFKNVAEKIQSYSKAFNLPATKRNNLIFDAIFEITRSYDGIIFNPYRRTQCVLKQDGFILFQGFLRLIDVSDKEGEISYNVNLYSEVTALADVLSDRLFSDLDFTELEHLYNRTNIENSWEFGGTGIAYTNPSTSGFRDVNSTVKYPFVDWNHSYTLSATNFPVLPDLETSFRPWINVKYLIDRIFNAPNTEFTYISNFFNTDTFKNLYMDFNWGADSNPNNIQSFGSAYYTELESEIYAGTSFGNFDFPSNTYPVEAGYDASLNKFTVPAGQDNQTYNFNYNLQVWAERDDTTDFQIKMVKGGVTTTHNPQTIALEGSAMAYMLTSTQGITQIVVKNGGYYPGAPPTVVINTWSNGSGATFVVNMVGASVDSVTVTNGGTGYNEGFDTVSFAVGGVTQDNMIGTFNGNFQETLNPGDTVEFQFKALNFTDSIFQSNQRTDQFNIGGVRGSLNCATSTQGITGNVLLQSLRGELGQWEFLKGLITMFNLVTTPDEDNPNNINIEPYGDIFINSADSKQLDWTDKIDISQIKLTPLTDLNKHTIFKFVEDDDDYAFNQYKAQVGGFLYGSQEYDAGAEFDILQGTDEIVAEPFAATVIKPLMEQYGDFTIPSLYSYNPKDGTSEGFENSPRILFNAGARNSTSCEYTIPQQNGVIADTTNRFLMFSHTTQVPVQLNSVDFNFGICQLLIPGTTPQNLFNTYWLPYYNQLYNPDTRIMTLKVNLSPADINTFKFHDTVYIKNRTFRVNNINYKPNDLATVEFILIP